MLHASCQFFFTMKQGHLGPLKASTDGFTVLEILVVLIMIGILSAIAAPAWLAFVNRQRLATSQEALYRAMQSAQSSTKRDKRTWQVSIREVTASGKPTVQWAVHPRQRGVFIPSGVQWNDLPPNVEVFKGPNSRNAYETTLDSPGVRTLEGPWRVQFNYHGNTNGQLGQITLTTGGKLRCVTVSTLIGTLRLGKENARPRDDKFCY